jgi:hypothetical protein
MTFAYLNQSLPSLSVLLESLDVQQVVPKSPVSLVTPRPASPLNLSPMEDESGSSAASSLNQQTPMSKRNHALHELLSSERNYASDLALIRDVHIPLALGHTLNIPIPSTNAASSSSSSRTLSTASDSSTSSAHGPPMTIEDTQIIFGNVPELALFADVFSEELEDALGSILEGGTGEDHVGELFLRIIPALEAPYKQYITRHSKALAHLSSLPKTPALTAYLQHTQTVAQALSHAWDISSLLIKPVQRFLKYSLLLSAIIEETPDSHGDKQNLRAAKERMDEVARSINESRRRWEVVQGVLAASTKSSEGNAAEKPTTSTPSKKKGLNVGTAASVNLTKIKSGIRPFAGKGNEEALRVQAMEAEIKAMSTFTTDYAKSVVEWTKTMSAAIFALRSWAIGFGQVLGLNQIQNSEAFEAFIGLIEEGLMPLSARMEEEVKETILVQLAKLRKTKESPMKLISAMKEEEPAHYHLLTMNVSAKNRPAPGLLESSQTYLALRGQLALELPVYLKALHRGIGVVVVEFAAMQARLYGDMRDKWGELWDALRVDGEMNAGGEETVKVWWSRWQDVHDLVAGLNVVSPRKMGGEQQQKQQPRLHHHHSMPIKARASTGSSTGPVMPSDLSISPSSSRNGMSMSMGMGKRPAVQTGAVVNMLSSLDPSHTMVSSPQSLNSNGSRTRGRGSSDASVRQRGFTKHMSSEAAYPIPIASSNHAGPSNSNYAYSPPSIAYSPSNHGYSPNHAYSPSSFPSTHHNFGQSQARPDSMGSFVDVGSGPWGSAVNGGGVVDRSSAGSGFVVAASLPPPPDYDTLANGDRAYARHSGSSANSGRPMGMIGEEMTRGHRSSLPRSSKDKEREKKDKEKDKEKEKEKDKDYRGRTPKTSTSSLKARLAGSMRPSTSSGSAGSGAYERQSMGTTGHGSSSSSGSKHGVLQRSNSLKERRAPSLTRRSDSHHRQDRPATPTYPLPQSHNPSNNHSNTTHAWSSHPSSSHRPSASFSSTSTTSTSSLPPHHSPSLLSRPALYQTAVVHPCKPPSDVTYQKIPFLVLKVDRVFDVLYEAGHPGLHEGLPLHVDDGEDCLLLVREFWGEGGSGGGRERKVGWALASFLVPLGG